MAVRLEATIKRFRGLSTDQKPGIETEEVGDELQSPPTGSVFTEDDTGERYVWNGSWPWVRMEQTVEALLNELIGVERDILAELQAHQRGHQEYVWGKPAPEEAGI